MIIDALLQFDSAFSFNQAAATYNSANVIDLGLSGLPTSASGGGARDIGIGDDPAMKLLVVVTATATSGGAATLAVNLQGAPDNGSGSPGSYTTMYTSPTYALATLVAGARLADIDMPRPVAGQVVPRFLRMTYVIGTAAGTGGTVQSELVLDRHDLPEQANATLGGYPAGITVAN